MIYRITLFLAVLIICQTGLTQSFFEAGITLGGVGYQGDLVQPAYQLKRTRPAVGAQARLVTNSPWNVSVGFLVGGISASDLDYGVPYRQVRALKLEARFYEGAISVEYHFFYRKNRITRYGVFDRFWSPFIGLGIGGVYVNRELHTPLNGETRDQGSAPSLFWIAPVRIGCRYDWSPRVAISIEAGTRPTFSDHFDGVIYQGRSDTHDWYLHAAVGIHLVIGGKE